MRAVDIIIRTESGIVLIKRHYEPFKGWWALPGGFIEEGESPEEAAIREAEEETGLKIKIERKVGVYDKDRNDPRGDIETTVFEATAEGKPKKGHEVEEISVFSEIPELAFDHTKIIEDSKKNGV